MKNIKNQLNTIRKQVSSIRRSKPKPKRRSRRQPSRPNYVHCDKNEIRLFTINSTANTFPIVVPINPGAVAKNNWDHTVTHYSFVDVFPRLRQLSRIYEYWRVKKLAFRYKTRIGTTQAGSIAWCFDYDPADNNQRLTEQEIAAHDPSASFAVHNNSVLKVDPRKCHMLTPWLYCRDSVVDTPRLYDAGQLVIKCSTNNIPVGDVYMEYEFEFAVPSIDDPSNAITQLTSVNPISTTRYYITPEDVGAHYIYAHSRNDDAVELEPGNYYVNLFFDAVANGISFIYTEVQKSTDGGATWTTVASDKKLSGADDSSISAVIYSAVGDLFRFGYELTHTGLINAGVRLALFALAKTSMPKSYP